jgi:hypothetical protein
MRNMKKMLMVLISYLLSFAAYAQREGDLLLGGSFDIIKTDNQRLLQKAQLGSELHYYFSDEITASVGVEGWTDKGVSFLIGTRWYPVEDAFIRLRGLVGENDVSLGAGWTSPLHGNWKFEALGDFYFKGEFSIRVGTMFILRTK